jgi:peroxiredoxin
LSLSPKWFFLAGLLAATLSSAAAAQSAAETSFRKDLALETMKTVEYFDDTGKRLDFAQFLKQVAAGRSFDIGHPTATSAAVSISASNAAAAGPSRYQIAPGAAFPSFKLHDNRGATVDNHDFIGQTTLVNFLFATCAPCIAELPVLNAFARAHPEMRTLGISFDSAREARQFVTQRHFDWPLLSDAQALVDAVGVTAYPAFALVGPDGHVLALSTSHEIAGAAKTLDVDNLFAWTAAAQLKPSTLGEELLAMEAQDQLARAEMSKAFQAESSPGPATLSALGTRIQNVDVANLARLRQIVAAHGWPGKAEVGGEAAHAVFILVQHADSDIALQKQYLAWLEKAWRSGAVAPAAGQAVAMLTDRIRGNEGKPQLYGTQVLLRDGKALVKPIEDAANVDKRRAAMGMPPLADYLSEVAKDYGATPAK